MRKLSILVIPGTDGIEDTVRFVCMVIKKIPRLRTYICGERDLLESLGGILGRRVLATRRVILYKLPLESSQWHGEALRLFINTNPDIIAYINREKTSTRFDAELFYPLALNRSIPIFSVVTRKNNYIRLGKVYDNVEELISYIERYLVI